MLRKPQVMLNITLQMLNRNMGSKEFLKVLYYGLGFIDVRLKKTTSLK